MRRRNRRTEKGRVIMAQNVLVTGAGRETAMGFNFVRRYLEQGDHVFATVRRPCEALEKLREQYPDTLDILEIDIGSTESVRAAAAAIAARVPCLDLIINNAVITTQDYKTHSSFEDTTLDDIAGAVDVSAVGPLRIVQAMQPLLYQSAGTAMVVNISSNCGSIGLCTTDRDFDYYLSKCAVNMGTKILYNKYAADKKVRMLAIHPGWVRTNPGNEKAPFDPYEQCEKMRLIFENRRESFDGVIFVNYDNEEMPW